MRDRFLLAAFLVAILASSSAAQQPVRMAPKGSRATEKCVTHKGIGNHYRNADCRRPSEVKQTSLFGRRQYCLPQAREPQVIQVPSPQASPQIIEIPTPVPNNINLDKLETIGLFSAFELRTQTEELNDIKTQLARLADEMVRNGAIRDSERDKFMQDMVRKALDPDQYRPGPALDPRLYNPGPALNPDQYRPGPALDPRLYRPGPSLDPREYERRGGKPAEGGSTEPSGGGGSLTPPSGGGGGGLTPPSDTSSRSSLSDRRGVWEKVFFGGNPLEKMMADNGLIPVHTDANGKVKSWAKWEPVKRSKLAGTAPNVKSGSNVPSDGFGKPWPNVPR